MADPYAARFLRIISTRRFWFVLFVTIYGALVCSTWKTVRSVLKWQANLKEGEGMGWPALYASVLFGAAFGVLAMLAMLAVTLPAMLLTWITILVMLAFAGKPRELLVLEGKRITRDIASFALKIMLKEGNLVAASCALFSFLLFIHRQD
ncbi:hypothetical protein SUGI_0618100 [Cryptomeria japonica]|uniref:uncharacterized protein LOC131044198 n=1 Tax=Cryptomeria japonica TaxID=3369 RepID=UPI0024147866|nr:uncharacterized protein LOC131044198 [Cryptomeria japonica]GLJ30968.1 hypothetical protein SUGI_0618100 [Cryptomeria japonica]